MIILENYQEPCVFFAEAGRVSNGFHSLQGITGRERRERCQRPYRPGGIHPVFYSVLLHLNAGQEMLDQGLYTGNVHERIYKISISKIEM